MSKETPMMKQYLEIKKSHPNDFLFYRLGDFYEMFFDDAVQASKILKINLTKRNPKSDIPMAGIPYHAADTYISKLISEGHSVAICEQAEDAQKGQLVKREVIRVITPSTVTEEELVDPTESIKLAAIDKSHGVYGVAMLNMSNGLFLIHHSETLSDALDFIKKEDPSEIIYSEEHYKDFDLNKRKGAKTISCDFFNYKDSLQSLSKYNLISNKYKNTNKYNSAIRCAGAILSYIEYTQKSHLSYIKEIRSTESLNKLIVDNISIRNLELIKNAEGGKEKTLFSTLNNTSSSLGARKLKDWILNPELDSNIINERLHNVSIIIDKDLNDDLASLLDSIPDIERVLTRISLRNAKPRDLASLRNVLRNAPELFELLKENELFSKDFFDLNTTKETLFLIESAIVETPPLLLKDGMVIKTGFDSELDEYRTLSDHSEEYLMDIEEREKEQTGISKLKLSYNKSDGFYISVPKGKIDDVPEHYMIKKTLKNENRYTISELQPLEEKILTANSKSLTRERILFNRLIDQLDSFVPILNDFCDFIAQVDVINSFAFISIKNNYCRPTIEEESFDIVEGRHPVIEHYLNEPFTSNDFNLKGKNLILLTGANMGGKSTYMRQNALIALMAHMGCYVPASQAKIKKIDRIFTRIGSGDNLAEGLSSFMLEMKEMSNILNNATKDSFVLVDEIGRGTSTYDGLSLAWSFAEELSELCDTIFSTHYFELTHLEQTNQNIVNMFMSSIKFRDEIIFLHKIDYGFVDQSYGLEVAKIAGIKPHIIENAINKLNNLKNSDSIINTLSKENIAVIEKIKMTDMETLNNEDAIEMIAKIKKLFN